MKHLVVANLSVSIHDVSQRCFHGIAMTILRNQYAGFLLPTEDNSGYQARPVAFLRAWWLRDDLPVNIIQLECPVQFVLHLSSRGDA